MKHTESSLATTTMVITVKFTSHGGNVLIDGKKVISQNGTIKYPIESGSHQGAFDTSGAPGESYSMTAVIENGPTLWEMHGTLDQTGKAAGQKIFQI